MSRLTKRVIDEVLLCDAESSICKEVCKSMDDFDHPCDVCPINEAIKKLAHYEDLEEQGRLIELPCKVGERLYFLTEKGDIENVLVDTINYALSFEGKIGKGFYRTIEEAEAKLAEMEGAE